MYVFFVWVFCCCQSYDFQRILVINNFMYVCVCVCVKDFGRYFRSSVVVTCQIINGIFTVRGIFFSIPLLTSLITTRIESVLEWTYVNKKVWLNCAKYKQSNTNDVTQWSVVARMCRSICVIYCVNREKCSLVENFVVCSV